MVLTTEAQKHKPKRPLNAYFKFRGQKMEELKDVADRKDQIAKMWEEMDPDVKLKMEEQFKAENEKYKEDLEAWKKKYDVQPEDMKRNIKKKKNEDIEDEKKPIKTKGEKENKKVEEKKKQEKQDTKKGKSVENVRGKSKKEEPKAEKKKGK